MRKKQVLCFGLLLLMGAGSAWSQSLYNEATYKPLVQDHRAYKVGDLLTVMIYEMASATTTANANTDVSVGVGVSASDGHNTVTGDLSAGNEFEGGGRLSRTGKLVASVSVSIEEVMPNGELRVVGDQFIELNNEMQRISVQGRVRPTDVGPQNTVASSRLADAEIRFKGAGLLTSGEKPGVITRFFNWLF